jgi:hypothetical protein
MSCLVVRWPNELRWRSDWGHPPWRRGLVVNADALCCAAPKGRMRTEATCRPSVSSGGCPSARADGQNFLRNHAAVFASSIEREETGHYSIRWCCARPCCSFRAWAQWASSFEAPSLKCGFADGRVPVGGGPYPPRGRQARSPTVGPEACGTDAQTWPGTSFPHSRPSTRGNACRRSGVSRRAGRRHTRVSGQPGGPLLTAAPALLRVRVLVRLLRPDVAGNPSPSTQRHLGATSRTGGCSFSGAGNDAARLGRIDCAEESPTGFRPVACRWFGQWAARALRCRAQNRFKAIPYPDCR